MSDELTLYAELGAALCATLGKVERGEISEGEAIRELRAVRDAMPPACGSRLPLANGTFLSCTLPEGHALCHKSQSYAWSRT